jgi:hypothetical protein
MIDPAVIDRIIVLAQVVLILGGVAVVIRLFDRLWDAAGRRRARRELQRGQRLVARRRAWEEVDRVTGWHSELHPRHEDGRLC